MLKGVSMLEKSGEELKVSMADFEMICSPRHDLKEGTIR
jgi:hypothetical protein